MQPPESNEAPDFIAHHGSTPPAIRIEPASKARDWMSGVGSFANRCLPMVVANQAGWMLLNSHRVSAVWDGGADASAVRLEYEDDFPPGQEPASSHFGLGVLTWAIPYLFRTPQRFNLLVRGPANMPKDGIAPLEGLVETDWSVATFTMNWKFTRPDAPVVFEVGEPFCMVVPQRRGELEGLRPAMRPIQANEQLHRETRSWAEGRHEAHVRQFLAEYSPQRKADLDAWQKHYYKGFTPEGREAEEHQNELRLRGFEPARSGNEG